MIGTRAKQGLKISTSKLNIAVVKTLRIFQVLQNDNIETN